MPLNKPGLEAELLELCSDPPDTITECAEAWAEAMRVHFAAIVPGLLPVHATALAPAKAALKSGLITAFGQPSAAAGMETAFAAFAVSVAGAMAPAFVGTPPPSPVGFAAFIAGPDATTHDAAAGQVADLIHNWAITGTATPPVGAPINWS